MLRHRAMGRAFAGMRAPSALGSFLRAFIWGTYASWSPPPGRSPATYPGTATCCPAVTRSSSWTSTPRSSRSTGAAKQGAEHGYTKVRGLHFQIVTASISSAAPVVVASRLRRGSAGSANGARRHKELRHALYCGP